MQSLTRILIAGSEEGSQDVETEVLTVPYRFVEIGLVELEIYLGLTEEVPDA